MGFKRGKRKEIEMLYDANYFDNMSLIHPRNVSKSDSAMWEFLRIEFRWFKLDK